VTHLSSSHDQVGQALLRLAPQSHSLFELGKEYCDLVASMVRPLVSWSSN